MARRYEFCLHVWLIRARRQSELKRSVMTLSLRSYVSGPAGIWVAFGRGLTRSGQGHVWVWLPPLPSHVFVTADWGRRPR